MEKIRGCPFTDAENYQPPEIDTPVKLDTSYKPDKDIKGDGIAYLQDDPENPILFTAITKKKIYKGENWSNLWLGLESQLMKQARNEEMTLADYKVRDCIVALIGIGNCVIVNQTYIAKLLNMHKVTVCKSIKKLVELQILFKGPKNGTSVSYAVSPDFMHKGTLGQGINAKKQTEKAKQQGRLLDFNSFQNN